MSEFDIIDSADELISENEEYLNTKFGELVKRINNKYSKDCLSILTKTYFHRDFYNNPDNSITIKSERKNILYNLFINGLSLLLTIIISIAITLIICVFLKNIEKFTKIEITPINLYHPFEYFQVYTHYSL